METYGDCHELLARGRVKIVVASPLAFWFGCSLSYRACSRKILVLFVVPAPLYA